MNKRNIIVVDTETTGLDPYMGHEITQVAGIALSPIDFEEIPGSEFQVFLKPQMPEKASAQALEKAGDSFNKAMAEGIDPKVGLNEFNKWCKSWNVTKGPWSKPYISGWNTPYDIKMLTYWMRHYKVAIEDQLEFGNVLDAMTVSFALFESQPDVNSFSLDNICKKLALKRESKTHDALEDVRLAAIILRRQIHFLRRCAAKMKITS